MKEKDDGWPAISSKRAATNVNTMTNLCHPEASEIERLYRSTFAVV